MTPDKAYQPKQFKLAGLSGISDQTLDMHFKLYEGYVKETNRLTERIAEFLQDGKVDQEEMPAYSELTRRLGFEYNGMVLHEYYFGNLKKSGGGDPAASSSFFVAAESPLAVTQSGKLTLLVLAGCAAWVGRSAIKIPAVAGCRTTGSPSTKSATLRASNRCSSWMCGNMHFCSITNRRSAQSISTPSSRILIGTRWNSE